MGSVNNRNQQSNISSIDEVLKLALDKLYKVSNNSMGLSGIPSGFEKLDQITSGWQVGNVIVVAGRPSIGKTSFATSLLKNIAIEKSIPSAYFCLESKAHEMVNRLVASYSNTPISNIVAGQLSKDEWDRLDNSITGISKSPIYIDDQTFDINEICDSIRSVVNKHDVKIAFVDYIQLIHTPYKISSNFTRNDELAYVMYTFKALAKELDIPIILLSQMNRYAENREILSSRNPQLTDLRESGSIEDDADVIIFIHRPEYYHCYEDEKGNDMRGIAQIIIAKHRMGYTGQLSLKFETKFARFSDIPKGDFF